MASKNRHYATLELTNGDITVDVTPAGNFKVRNYVAGKTFFVKPSAVHVATTDNPYDPYNAVYNNLEAVIFNGWYLAYRTQH
jgi:hypothetical protein